MELSSNDLYSYVNDLLDNIEKAVQKNPIDTNQEHKKDRPYNNGVYLFVSLDLSNSTLFKNRYPDFWWYTVKSFYEQVKLKYNVITSQQSNYGFDVWKYVGDEVLLYKRIVKVDDIYDDIKLTNEALTCIIPQIVKSSVSDLVQNKSVPIKECRACTKDKNDKDICPCTDYYDSVSKQYESAVTRLLKIKATMWIADCSANYDETFNNIIYNASDSYEALSGSIIDFLGPDMDEGFRLSKFAEPNRLIVSPKLAYIIFNSKESKRDSDKLKIYLANFKIVLYQDIKGVWDNRRYPIVLFNHDFINILHQGAYDDIYTSEILKEITKNGVEDYTANSPRSSLESLSEIFKSVDKLGEVEELLHKVEEQCSEKVIAIKNNKTEIHVACIAYQNNKILILKHKKRGWEFGCIHLPAKAVSWKYEIETQYKSAYGLDIEVEDPPQPIALYNYSSPNRNAVAFGIIVLGKLKNNFESFSCANYSEPKLISLEDLDSIKEDNAVSNFFTNIKRAFETAMKNE